LADRVHHSVESTYKFNGFSAQMRALANIRSKQRTWRICPWTSVRSAVLSLILVGLVAIVFDHWVLANLERRGLVAADSWKRHNRMVVENHHRKDRNLALPGPKWASSSGVRAWLGHPVTRERTKRHRLLVMGDSFVWESPYLTLNHMWWRQLGIELKRRGYHDVEVIAAGTSGMSTHEELDLARRVVPEFQPDLILWGFVTNDPDERMIKQINSSQLAPPIPGRVQVVLKKLTPRLLDLFLSRRNDKLAVSYLGPEYGYEYSDWVKRIHEGANFEAYKTTVNEVAMFMAEVNVPGMLVTLPEAPIPERFAFSYDKVLPLWREAGVPVLDNLPALVQKYPNAEATGPKALVWGINPADGHPGPRSTAFLARQTADRLERDYPQFLGPKSSEREPIQINDWLPFDLDVKPVPGDEGFESFELSYPATEQFLPTMPLAIPPVLVAFEQPTAISAIQLQGDGLKSARLWLSTYDPVDFYDTEDWTDLGSERGSELAWKIPSELSHREVSILLIRADVSSGARRLVLKIRPSDARRSAPPKGER
jgi:hypothetical protein